MASTLMARSCHIWTSSSLLKMSSVQVRNIRAILSCHHTQINCKNISKMSVHCKRPLSNPVKPMVLPGWQWSQLARMCSCNRILTNSLHTSSICTRGKDDNTVSRNLKENNGNDKDPMPSGSKDTQNYSKVDGKRFVEQQKQQFKTMLDDAQSQKSAPDDFDFSDIPQRKEEITEKGSKKVKMDPAETSVLLFPGQGAQFVGMGERLLHYPVVKEMYRVASEILGYDLLSLCLEGPKEDLDRTVHCQPAVLVTSLAAVEKLKNENPKAIENCVATAGFSVGEYAALVFGGVLSFEDAIYLIKIRAEAMQRASDLAPSGMISVIGGRGAAYKQMCAEAVNYCEVNLKMEKPVCRVANYLFQHARVLAGHDEALKFIIDMKRQFRLFKVKRLPVSGAFHTPLMAPAEDALSKALEDINIEEPLVSIHSNVDSKQYCHVKHIRKQLRKQVVEPVLWEQTMCEIYQRKKGEKFPVTYEVGPGNQLGTMLQRYNLKAFQSYYKVDV